MRICVCADIFICSHARVSMAHMLISKLLYAHMSPRKYVLSPILNSVGVKDIYSFAVESRGK